MKIKMTSTDKKTEIDGVEVRLWEGRTESGVKCKVFVHTIAADSGDDSSQFDLELKEKLPPGSMVDLRQIL